MNSPLFFWFGFYVLATKSNNYQNTITHVRMENSTEINLNDFDIETNWKLCVAKSKLDCDTTKTSLRRCNLSIIHLINIDSKDLEFGVLFFFCLFLCDRIYS